MKKSEIRDRVLDALVDAGCKQDLIDEVSCALSDIENGFCKISKKLGDVDGLDTLSYIEEAKDLADEYELAMY